MPTHSVEGVTKPLSSSSWFVEKVLPPVIVAAVIFTIPALATIWFEQQQLKRDIQTEREARIKIEDLRMKDALQVERLAERTEYMLKRIERDKKE